MIAGGGGVSTSGWGVPCPALRLFDEMPSRKRTQETRYPPPREPTGMDTVVVC